MLQWLPTPRDRAERLQDWTDETGTRGPVHLARTAAEAPERMQREVAAKDHMGAKLAVVPPREECMEDTERLLWETMK